MADREDDLKNYWDLLTRYRAASPTKQKTMIAVSIPLLYHTTTNVRLKEALELFRRREWLRHHRGETDGAQRVGTVRPLHGEN
jgi:hypothetical protein